MGALKVIPVPGFTGISVSSSDRDWQFRGNDGLKHFWSTDGTECLWCGRIRTLAEVGKWRLDGEPEEMCNG